MKKAVGEFIPATFRVSDFLSWQREGSLDLDPEFQRRSAWKPGAKSYLVDTIVRGLPVPLVFLRERLDLLTGRTVREVVDGQQRIRTLLGFIDPSSLPDYTPDRDWFVVSKSHNPDIADRQFEALPEDVRAQILSYRFSVQILPASMTNNDILEIFARLNSTGLRLNAQELRNAAYFGELKNLMYQLAYEQTERWLVWDVFSPDQLARMAEVELTSDLSLNMVYGLSGKSQPRLSNFYKVFEREFPFALEVKHRFPRVMELIDYNVPDVRETVYSREVHFFTLWIATYDLTFGPGTMRDATAKRLPTGYTKGVLEASRRFREWEVPPEVVDAVARASADFGRRKTRVEYLKEIIRQFS